MQSLSAFIAPELAARLDYFYDAAQTIAQTAVQAGAETLFVAVCGSRGNAGATVTPQSDLDMLVVVASESAKKSLQEKIKSLPCLHIAADLGRASRRLNQAPRREDVLELSEPVQPGYAAEVDATVLTLAEFESRYKGVANMFDHCTQGEDIAEADLAKHHLLSGFAGSRIGGATAIYDPYAAFAQARQETAQLSEPTARALFERYIKILAHLTEHVESDWKNIFERASDQAIVLDALIRAHYALNRELCQPGYKNYPDDLARLAPDLSNAMGQIVQFGQQSGPEHLRLIGRITRSLIDQDRRMRGEPPLSLQHPGFLAKNAVQSLLKPPSAQHRPRHDFCPR